MLNIKNFGLVVYNHHLNRFSLLEKEPAYAPLVVYLSELELDDHHSDLIELERVLALSKEEATSYFMADGNLENYEKLGLCASLFSDSYYNSILYNFEKGMIAVTSFSEKVQPIVMSADEYVTILKDWIYFLHHQHFPSLIWRLTDETETYRLLQFWEQQKQGIFSRSVIKDLKHRIQRTQAIIQQIATLRDLSTRRPLLARESVELAFLEKIQAADSLEILQSLENELNNTPTDADLITRLQKYIAEKKAFY